MLTASGILVTGICNIYLTNSFYEEMSCIVYLLFYFSVPRLQRGSPGSRPTRHRLRRVRERNTIGLGPRRAPRLQDHAQLGDEDLLRQKVNENEYRDVTAFLWIAS
jgi:hypothetical protein